MDWRIKKQRAATSTNDVLKRLAEADEAEGLVVWVQEQTEGRGREGRKWHSPAGRGLYFSFLLRPKYDSRSVPQLSALVARAAGRTIEELTGAKQPALRFKLPNDLYWGDRKLGGILLESASRAGRIKYLVIGVGINLHGRKWPAELAGKAVSLAEACGQKISARSFLGSFLDNFAVLYSGWGLKSELLEVAA